MIGSSENRISYNGNGIATEFAYTFKILEKSNLKVLHVAADGTEELLTTDYYVDMEKSVVLYPGYAPGAEIPEQNRPPILPVGERLVLYREVPITQESALDKHWPFNVIENGLDKLTIICQQIWDRLQRSFYVSESTSTNFDPKVPIEAGKTFRVKDDGTGFEVTEDPGKVIDGATALLKQTTEQAELAKEQADASSQSAVNAQNAANSIKKYKALWFDNVATMKAEPSLTAGAYVNTAGYYSPNDGGGASYLIREKLEADADDGGSIHELSNGLVAELIVEKTSNAKQFGAQEASNSTDFIQKYISFCKAKGIQCNIVGCFIVDTLMFTGEYLLVNQVGTIISSADCTVKIYDSRRSNFKFDKIENTNLTGKAIWVYSTNAAKRTMYIKVSFNYIHSAYDGVFLDGSQGSGVETVELNNGFINAGNVGINSFVGNTWLVGMRFINIDISALTPTVRNKLGAYLEISSSFVSGCQFEYLEDALYINGTGNQFIGNRIIENITNNHYILGEGAERNYINTYLYYINRIKYEETTNYERDNTFYACFVGYDQSIGRTNLREITFKANGYLLNVKGARLNIGVAADTTLDFNNSDIKRYGIPQVITISSACTLTLDRKLFNGASQPVLTFIVASTVNGNVKVQFDDGTLLFNHVGNGSSSYSITFVGTGNTVSSARVQWRQLSKYEM